MRNCDIKFVNKEITPFGGLSLFFKMLEKCHFEEQVMQSGVPPDFSAKNIYIFNYLIMK